MKLIQLASSIRVATMLEAAILTLPFRYSVAPAVAAPPRVISIFGGTECVLVLVGADVDVTSLYARIAGKV